jgi:hypothetical protein
MKILLQNSHHQSGRTDGWSGAPGEARWVLDLNDRIEAKAQAAGIGVTRVDGDLQDHPEYHADYDLFDAPHYEANLHYSLGLHLFPHRRCGLIPEELMARNHVGRITASTDSQGHVGGWLWGRASSSATALLDDKIGRIFQQVYGSYMQNKGYDMPFRDNWNNVNIMDYYGFRLTSSKTAGWLTEHGVGAPGAPDHDWLFNNVDDIASNHVKAYIQFAGITPIPVNDVHLFGVSSVPFAQVFNAIRVINPTFSPEWAVAYFSESPIAGIRWEFALAQMLKETDYGRFTGIAQPEWNNPAGLGVTGGPGIGNRFPTKHDGVVAHLQHLIWYLWSGKHADTPYCTPLVDLRHTTRKTDTGKDFGEHKMFGNDITLLNGKWATPGPTYGQDIAKLASDLRGDSNMPDEVAIQKMIDVSVQKGIEDLKGGLKHDYIDTSEFEGHDHRGGTVTYTKNQ